MLSLAKKYAELYPKTDDKKEKKGKAVKEEKPKQEKKPKKELDGDEDDDLPKQPKAKDPYAGLPKRLGIHTTPIYSPAVVCVH